MKIALICSSGGHFYQLYSLKEFWEPKPHFWVTFPGRDTMTILEENNEQIYYAYNPTNRNIKNFFKNLWLAWKIIYKEKPSYVVSTGAGISVPFIYIAKLHGIKTVYIESLTRIDNLSLSGKLVAWCVDHLLVQWPTLAEKYKKARFIGQVI